MPVGFIRKKLNTKTTKIFGLVASIGIAGLLIFLHYTNATAGQTTTLGPASNATNAWTNPTNAYGTTDNNVYATAAPGRNASISGDWGTFGFDSTLPTNATITKVEIIPQYKVSVATARGQLDIRGVVSGTACPVISDTSEPTTDTEFTADVTSCRTWTRANLLDAAFVVRLGATKSNTNTAETFSLDYIKVRVTYSTPDLNQVAWRWFNNADSTNVGTALAAQNTTATLVNYGDAFRLRALLNVTTAQIPAGTNQFKLQYAGKGGGSCAAPSGTPSSYTDVSASTLIKYNDNPTPAHNVALTANASDPVRGGVTVVNQTYNESNTVSTSTAIPVSQDGKWDFSLKDNDAPSSTTYCFRVVNLDGSTLNTYTVYPEITTATGILTTDIVDAGGSSVASPSASFSGLAYSFSCTTSTATLGISSQKIRTSNTLSQTGWTLSVAATSGMTGLWSSGTPKYDYNDSAGSPAGCSAGSDSDAYAGQLSVGTGSVTISPSSGCTNTGVSAGSSSAFSEGTVDSITLLSATGSSSRGCYWDLTGIGLSQKVPSEQSTGSYSLGLTLTILAN